MTRYGLAVRGLNPAWGKEFLHLSITVLGTTQGCSGQVPRYRFSFPGVKQLGHGIDHPAASSTEAEETVEL
jgi:hypothetical protein